MVAREGDQLKQSIMWVLVAILCACSMPHPSPYERPLNPLPTHVEGASETAIAEAEKRLNEHGVQLVSQGDDYLISIPGASLFYENSPRIRWKSYTLLNDVTRYLRLYRKVSVQVSVFSNRYRSAKREQALTHARANAVANYLWSQGIHARFIYAYAEGADKPIVENPSRGERTLNSRVEITFREVVA